MCFFSLHVGPPRGGMGLGSCWSSLASNSSSLVGTRPAWMVRVGVPQRCCHTTWPFLKKNFLEMQSLPKMVSKTTILKSCINYS